MTAALEAGLLELAPLEATETTGRDAAENALPTPSCEPSPSVQEEIEATVMGTLRFFVFVLVWALTEFTIIQSRSAWCLE